MAYWANSQACSQIEEKITDCNGVVDFELKSNFPFEVRRSIIITVIVICIPSKPCKAGILFLTASVRVSVCLTKLKNCGSETNISSYKYLFWWPQKWLDCGDVGVRPWWAWRCYSVLFSNEYAISYNFNLFPNFNIPHYQRTTFGRRAFSVAGPTLWNLLPDKLRRWYDL